MSLDTYRGSVWAWTQLMKQAEKDIEAGKLAKARVIYESRSSVANERVKPRRSVRLEVGVSAPTSPQSGIAGPSWDQADHGGSNPPDSHLILWRQRFKETA